MFAQFEQNIETTKRPSIGLKTESIRTISEFTQGRIVIFHLSTPNTEWSSGIRAGRISGHAPFVCGQQASTMNAKPLGKQKDG